MCFLWLACWVRTSKMHLLHHFDYLMSALNSIYAVLCGSIWSVDFLFFLYTHGHYAFGSAWEQTAQKQYHSMPADSPGDVYPSALWRVMSRMERRRNLDPLVSFRWHLYYFFVTLDREPKETAWEEKAVWRFLYQYVCIDTCMCVRARQGGGKGKRTKKGRWYWGW